MSQNNFNQLGHAMVHGVLDRQTCDELVTSLGPVIGAGRRGLLAAPQVATLAMSPILLNLVRWHIQPHVLTNAIPVRAIYFDKSPTSNWLVPWHQDLTVALAEKIDMSGFGPWSIKDGVPHVQPPIKLLEQMVTLRIHLDDTPSDNGPLKVLPGSHKLGLLSPQQIIEQRNQKAQHLCTANQGDVMFMRPLLLHASAKSTSGHHRRILHIEYAGFELPGKLAWHESVMNHS